MTYDFTQEAANDMLEEADWEIAVKVEQIKALTARAEQAEAERDELKATLYAFFANLPNSVIEEALEVWNNTNTRIILEARQAAIDKLKGGEA